MILHAFRRLSFLVVIILSVLSVHATQTDIVGPAGSGLFGNAVLVLPNGNLVVTDPAYDLPGPVIDVGAVYMYDGATLALISVLTGSVENDQVGNTGVQSLANGNFVVRSSNWNDTRGAVTFCNAVTGCNGIVSSANSLVGSTPGDQIGSTGVTPLKDGSYVVRSQDWDNGAIVDAGAATWGNGATGTSGVVSSSNSLVGSTATDQVGSSGVVAMTNGNYVVRSANWDNGAIIDAGAATWGNGATGTSGVVSSSNSLVGSTASDQVGGTGVVALSKGNYVVRSSNWDNGAATNAGAATWGNGAAGTSGVVSGSNSLVGSTAGDGVSGGTIGVAVLANGNYVVISSDWDNGAATNAGAVTWGNGATGISGVVSSANSLVGSTANNNVGTFGVTGLANGNYVVASPSWDNPSPAVANVGAVTWGNGATGISGAVSSANSLVGSTAADQVGNSVVSLTNGNYVVRSPSWDNGAILNAGAVTWGNGMGGISGAVSSANSLVGSTASDQVGTSATALTNGNYVVTSPNWDSGAITNAGAATWGNGASGTSGAVSSVNSLVGSTAGDQVGIAVTALTNGNYVVTSPGWDNGAIDSVGAATWGNGTIGISGAVSGTNSLVGSTTGDQAGSSGVVALANGSYVVRSPNWNRGAIVDAGAVTWGNGTNGISGAVSNTNSLVGSTASDTVGAAGGVGVALNNGNYFVFSGLWNNGAIPDAGAVTFGSGAGGTVGAITNGSTGGNSVVGTSPFGVNDLFPDATSNRLFVGRESSNVVSVLSFTTTATADGDVGNAANWSNGLPNGLVTGIIPGGRTMTISSVQNFGQLRIECGGVLNGGGPTAYVVGSVRKDFCSASNQGFTFHVGDPSNYSPVTLTNANGTGNLTVSVVDTFMPAIRPTATSLSRYWSLAGSGITTDMSFRYVDSDVSGIESNYALFVQSFGYVTFIGGTVNTAVNTITAIGVSQFSDWGVSQSDLFPPTSANVSIGGRVMTSDGAGIRNAIVQLALANGEARIARTSSFGYYRFDDIESGQTVVVSIASKRFTFSPRAITLTGDLSDLDFTPIE